MKFSVLMSVYNESEKEVRESIESIRSQTLGEFEFIIVNDNPNRKELVSLLKKYEELDNRIILLKNDENLGLAYSLNKAASIARTDVYARMDADDISELTRFEFQYKIIENGSCDFVFTGYKYIDENSQEIRSENNSLIWYSTDEIERMLPYKSPIHHPTVMMTRKIFEKAGGYRNFPCAQDRDLWLRIWENGGKFYMLKEQLLNYRIRANSISETKKLQQKLTIDYIQNLFLERLENGSDSYSLTDYYDYIEKNRFNDKEKKIKMLKYNNILRKALSLRMQKKYFTSTILKIKVFVFSPMFRKSYLKKLKTKKAISAYKKKHRGVINNASN